MNSGKIARLLNGGNGTKESVVGAWGQNIGSDIFPVLNGKAVYCVTANSKNIYGNSGASVSLPARSFDGTKIETITEYTDGQNSYTDSYTIANEDVTLTVKSSGVAVDMANNTETIDGNTYYKIANAEQFDWLSYYVNSSSDNASTNAILTDNLDLGTDQTMIGTLSFPYNGIFDGNGKTLTVNYNVGCASNSAPFAVVTNTTIKNLKVAGTVASKAYHAAGLISIVISSGNVASAPTITNCEVAAAISSLYCGGFIGHGKTSTPTFTDCSFTGSLSAVGGKTAPFVGWKELACVPVYNNCLSMPSSVSGTSYAFTNIGNNGTSPYETLNNCFVTNKVKFTTLNPNGTVIDGTKVTSASAATSLQGTSRTAEAWIYDPTTTSPALKTFAAAAQLTKSDKDATSYYNSLAWTIPSGLKVYTINKVESGKAIATEYKGTVVPAGTAVVISGDAGDYTLAFDRSSTLDAVSGNLLRGSDIAATTAGDDATTTYSFYKLGWNSDNSAFGFYYGTDTGVAFDNIAHNAYLPLSSESASAKGYVLSIDGQSTGITSISNNQSEKDDWYTLSGMKLGTRPTATGIYINKGKKVIVQ